MLLVLSTPHDDTARRFAAHAGRCGYPVWGPWNGGALDVCAEADRDGRATSEIWCRRTGTRVRSILNRGYCPGGDADAFLAHARARRGG